MVDSSTSIAGRWFGVRAEAEQVGPARKLGRGLWAVVFGIITVYDLDETKRLCNVFIFRRDNEQIVATYSYRRVSEAIDHIRSLRDRLETLHVYDFCRALGIGVHEVAGGGTSEQQDLADVWSEMPRAKSARPLW